MDDWGRRVGKSIGPLFSKPSDPQLLFSSPSLSPPLPHLASSALSYNRLQFLPCPAQNSVLLFFPTGSNLDQIGFLLLSTRDSGRFRVLGSDVFVPKERFCSRILKILVQPISNKSSSSVQLGYVLFYSLYSIHWYVVNDGESPVLRYLGQRPFKSGSIASASWSPFLSGQCLVLLENGVVFEFVRDCTSFKGCKLKVSWEGQRKLVDNKSWLGCEFAWRLGVFIVARSDAVFVITKSSGNCTVRSLLEAESLNMGVAEEFVGFAKAGSDSFRFIVASRSYVFLCDQRSVVPLLKFQHHVERPCFIDVFDLGGRTDTSCIIIGSFWNAQSQMFCYGPSPSAAEDPSSLHVWDLPHNILLPAGTCLCVDCKFREVRMKEYQIDWQKKRVVVLGFGLLNKYLSPLGSSDQSSGFTVVRLTSSGNLEAVKFRASHDPIKCLQAVSHIDSDEVNLLYLPDDEEYKFPKRFEYLDLGYFSAHVKGTLAKLLDSKMRTKLQGSQKNESSSLIFHKELCEKLNICGFGNDRDPSKINAVFDNINSPTNIFDISLRETWSSLPIEFLLLAFSNDSEFDDVMFDKKKPSLEFLVVPEFPQLPPFFLRKPSSRSSKWSKKEQPGVELVGPAVPLPVLLTLHEFRKGRRKSKLVFSPEAELSNRCNQVSKVTREVANSGVDKTTISLGADQDDSMRFKSESQKEKKAFIAYRPITKTADSDQQQEEVTTFVSRMRRCKDGGVEKRAGLEWLDDLSPVEICFEDRSVDLDMKALRTSKNLLSQWQQRSSSYQEYLSKYHLHR
ncbi:hypothetical protein AALP_AAs43032U000100 [Arabis alpina]|uniref:Uncharacterized protein n=1 Tax=Arabis alpina TaxID=50452 RepID=A0A087FX05_ARAAL|nr:hypothetical protein AALP_AAs43032U000100 [Arabis alpina]